MMSSPITTTTSTSPPVDATAAAIPVWCGGCRAVHPLSAFLHRLDQASYRLNVQCRACLGKSSRHYRKHCDDIKAARQVREQQSERVMCVCGVSIHTQYRDKHCQSKRHRTVVALLHSARDDRRTDGTAEKACLPGLGSPSQPSSDQQLRYRPSLPKVDEVPSTIDTADNMGGGGHPSVSVEHNSGAITSGAA